MSADLKTEPGKPANGATTLVPAIVKAIAVLRYINSMYPKKASLADIAAKNEITRSHCYNILQTLKEMYWVTYDSETKLYGISRGIYRDLSCLLVENQEVAEIRPILTQLVKETGVPCVLSQRLEDETFFLLEKFNPNQSVEVSLPIGYRYPSDAPAQLRAYLAFQSPAVTDAWFESWVPTGYTDQTITTPADLRAELEQTRLRGFAVSHGEFTPGLTAIGMPIFNGKGEVIFVFNCSWMAQQPDPRERRIIERMAEARNKIHQAIAAVSPI